MLEKEILELYTKGFLKTNDDIDVAYVVRHANKMRTENKYPAGFTYDNVGPIPEKRLGIREMNVFMNEMKRLDYFKLEEMLKDRRVDENDMEWLLAKKVHGDSGFSNWFSSFQKRTPQASQASTVRIVNFQKDNHKLLHGKFNTRKLPSEPQKLKSSPHRSRRSSSRRSSSRRSSSRRSSSRRSSSRRSSSSRYSSMRRLLETKNKETNDAASETKKIVEDVKAAAANIENARLRAEDEVTRANAARLNVDAQFKNVEAARALAEAKVDEADKARIRAEEQFEKAEAARKNAEQKATEASIVHRSVTSHAKSIREKSGKAGEAATKAGEAVKKAEADALKADAAATSASESAEKAAISASGAAQQALAAAAHAIDVEKLYTIVKRHRDSLTPDEGDEDTGEGDEDTGDSRPAPGTP
jgi:hypothetical protein